MTFSLTEDERHTLNRRLLTYLRKSATRGPNHERIDPFVARFRPDDDNRYVNYAIPDDDADPTADDIAALIAAFVARQRKPRLEYITAAAPKVEDALLEQGFVPERRTPIMLCTPGMEQGEPVATGFDIFAASREADLTGVEAAQAEAYAGPSHGPAGLLRNVKYGGVVAAARDRATGAIVGGGVANAPIDGISEVAGIGVRHAARRKGIARAMTVLLTREAFAHGTTLLWLTPEDPDTQRIYARAGFAVASEALHISR